MSKEAKISAINIINTILFVFGLFYTFSDINAMQSMFEKGCVCACVWFILLSEHNLWYMCAVKSNSK